MAYRLAIADRLEDAARQCARAELAGAIAQLEGTGAPADGASARDPATAIHEARKHLKKTRALLRLVRPALGEAAYRRENAALRDAARRLSAVRDADVLVATVEALAATATGRLPAADFAALRAALAAEAAALRGAPDRGGAASGGTVAAAVADALRGALARVEAWPLADAPWAAVVPAAERTYRRGRAAFAAASARPTVEALHEWRKRVKDLWYHHRLLDAAWPPMMGAVASQAHALSELLGDDHDLAVLRERLRAGIALPPGAAADRDVLVALIDGRRAALQARALSLGGRLYAERPGAFARRLGRWLAVAAEAHVAGEGGFR
jgi:CHAD domain-containing protein